MADLVVHDLEEDVHDRLQGLADSRGHSVEEEIRDILRGAVMGGGGPAPASGLGTRIASRFAGRGLDQDVAELRGTAARIPSFES